MSRTTSRREIATRTLSEADPASCWTHMADKLSTAVARQGRSVARGRRSRGCWCGARTVATRATGDLMPVGERNGRRGADLGRAPCRQSSRAHADGRGDESARERLRCGCGSCLHPAGQSARGCAFLPVPQSRLLRAPERGAVVDTAKRHPVALLHQRADPTNTGSPLRIDSPQSGRFSDFQRRLQVGLEACYDTRY